MAVLSDRDIRDAIEHGRVRLDPYDPTCIQPSSVDLHLDREFRVFRNNRYPYIDVRSPQPDLTRNRLPTLFEVLSRRTLPPVDLFSFYIYMRDQQRSVDYLDFW